MILFTKEFWKFVWCIYGHGKHHYVVAHDMRPEVDHVWYSTECHRCEAERQAKKEDWLKRMAEAEDGCGGIMACSPEILQHFKENDPLMYDYAMGKVFPKTEKEVQ